MAHFSMHHIPGTDISLGREISQIISWQIGDYFCFGNDSGVKHANDYKVLSVEGFL